jgi:peptidoglycan/xylan/chitin deacetylase (PgdA/CDA1 family)
MADAGLRRVLPPPDRAGRRIVLCYHSVNPAPSYLSLSPARFEAHLAWLAEHSQVVSLEELVACPRGSGGPHVAITFDDGYADNHEHALPALRRYGMTASFFVTAGFLDRDAEVMAHLSHVWRASHEALPPLAWSAVGELRAAGMSIGSHTWSHRNLALLSPAEAEHDLTRGREVIEARLGARVPAVAYPWGKLGRHVTEATFAAARRAGHELGGISLPRAVRRSDPALRIPRVGVGAEAVERLAAKVTGSIDWHAHVHERMPARVARVLFADDAGS